MTGSPRIARQWLEDSVRFAFALFYWNARKSLHVVRGRRGRCPCHHPSDDDVAGRVQCDAVLGWHNPARFRAVCPLLERNERGWVCSVPAARVRPFWGRAIAWAAAGFLAFYLVGVTAVFAALRGWGGAPVAWAQIAWPGRWPQIRQAQSRGFFARAIEAFRAGRLPEAKLALITAQTKDPDNYDVGLLLAQISMYQGNWDHADGAFYRLLQRHPGKARRTGQVMHDTLLALGRGGRLAQLSLRMAVEDKEHAALWVRSLLLGLRLPGKTADWPPLDDGSLRPLAPHARRLVRAQMLARSQDAAGARAELRAPHAGPFNPVYMEQHVELLARLGDARAAQTLWDFYAPMLGGFESGALQYALDMLQHDEGSAGAAFRRILRLKLSAAQVERLAARLIAHPSAASYRALHERLLGDPALAAQADGPTLWLTGLVCGAPAEAAHWKVNGLQKYREIYPSITRVNFAGRDRADRATPANLVNTLSFPWEISCALLARAATGESR